MGRGTYLGEALSVSGILKVLETILLFTTVIIHRHGDNGKYLFFGTTAVQMKAVRGYSNNTSYSREPRGSANYLLGFLRILKLALF